MSRIDWGRHSGDEVETVVGILLCRRHERVERVKPSQGDGGLDVIRRGENGWAVWQVKKHSEQPNSDQRSKIKKSLNRALGYAERNSIHLESWNLVTPVNPTPESLTWFRKVTDQCGVPCAWLGEEFIDGLASEFPEVIDYYFRDGRQRLGDAVAEFASMSRIRAGIGETVEPVDAVEALTAAHKVVNKLDPHYLYDFAVSSNPPELRHEEPGLAFASVEGIGDQYVTIKIIERYDGALDDRPITAKGVFHTPDDESRQAVRDFFEYGAPLDIARATMSIDLPGGLDGSERDGALQITPREPDDEDLRFIRYRVGSSTNSDISTVKLRVHSPSRGVDGKNWRSVAEEWPSKSFSVEQRYTDETDIMKLDFKLGEVSGAIPDRILPGLRFIRELKAGRHIRLGAEVGPMSRGAYPLTKDLCDLVPASLIRLLESISTIQEATSTQLRVPNLSELSDEDGTSIIKAALLLRGESVAVQTPAIRFRSRNDAENPRAGNDVMTDGDNSVYIAFDHSVKIGEIEVSIGSVGFHATGTLLTVERDSNGTPTGGVVRPIDGAETIRGELRRVPDAER